MFTTCDDEILLEKTPLQPHPPLIAPHNNHTHPLNSQHPPNYLQQNLADKPTFKSLLSGALESSNNLFKWTNFEFRLPKSIFEFEEEENSEDLKQLFILPNFEENYNKKLINKYLNHNQLQSIKRRGTFVHPSHNYPGQFHKWKLNELFQKGSETAYEEFLNELSFALRFINVYALKLLFYKQQFSFANGLQSLCTYLFEFFDLIIGVGKNSVPNLERRIQEERCKFLVAELKCNKGDEKNIRELASYIRSQVSKAMKERVMCVNKKPPPIPYRFVTPQGMDCDLRLFDKSLFRKASAHLLKLLERCNRQTDGWFFNVREKVIRKSFNQFESNKMIMDEYLTRLYNSIRACEELKQMDIDRVLIQQAQLTVVMQRSLDRVLNHELQNYLKNEEIQLKRGCPLLSRDGSWLKMQMINAENKFYAENQFLGHEIAIQFCKEEFLQQGCYFIQRDLIFQRDTCGVLRKELLLQQQPTRLYIWKTIFAKEIGFSSSSHLFYRFQNIFYRLIVLFLSIIYLFGYWLPWNSKFSLRTLTNRNYENNIFEIFHKIWRNVSKERSKFENNNRSRNNLSRGWNIFLNYFIKGTLPTLTLSFTLPIIIIFGGAIATLTLLSSWLLAPVLSVMFHVFCVLIYDFDSPEEETLKLFRIFQIIFQLLTKGILQPIISALTAIIFCPIASSIIATVSILKYGIRLVWDSLIYYLMIKQKGKLPLQNSWIVKRVEGPGLLPQSPFLLEITPLQGLCALLSRLETEELNYYYKSTLKTLQCPLERYELFYTNYLKPFNTQLEGSEPGPYKELITETLVNKNLLEEIIMRRKLKLQLGLDVNNRSLIRMKKNYLEKTLVAGKGILNQFYNNLFLKYQIDESSFWEGRGLNIGDYNNLTMILFSEVFSQEFLCPLNEYNNFCAAGGASGGGADVCFPLEMSYKPPVRLLESLNSMLQQDEDELFPEKPILTMSRVNYKIHSPYLGIEAFSPFTIEHLQRDEGYLPIPPPIFHPVYISVIIHNREEQELIIEYDKPICQAILGAIVDSPTTPSQDCISLNLSTSTSSYSTQSKTDNEDNDEDDITTSMIGGDSGRKGSTELDDELDISLTSYLGTSV